MKLLQAHVLEGLKQLADESIDLVVTSPPYWGLRDYGPTAKTVWDGQVDCQHEWTSQKQELQHEARNGLGSEELSPREGKIWHREDASIAGLCLKCGAWQGQLGLEPSFQLFIQHLSTVFQEIKRILKKSGSVYLNLGDTYAGGNGVEGRPQDWHDLEDGKLEAYPKTAPAKHASLPAKCLIGLPWRMALRLIDDGWILRNAIIWHKPNHMPSSVRDRLSNSYEFIFHLVRSKRYFYNLDAIREPHQSLGVPNAIIANTKRETPREYSGKFADTGLQGESRYQVDPEKFNSPRARTQRHREISRQNGFPLEAAGRTMDRGLATAGLYDPERTAFYNEQGKNPGDVSSPEYRDWYFNQREKTGWHNHTEDSTMGLGHQHRLMSHPDAHLPHPDGKHPDDVLKIGNHHGSSLTLGRATHYMNQEILPNPIGANPSDTVDETVQFFREKGKGGNYDYGGIDSSEAKHFHPNGANPSDFWTITTQPFPEAHFAVFPLGICWNPILSSCPENGTVLDPFAGSGTVAEAVELLNLYGKKPSNEQVRQAREAKTRPLIPAAHRETVLIEINPEYCKIIEKRLSPYTVLGA